MPAMFDLQDGVFPPDRLEGVEAIGKDQKKLVSPAPFQPYMQTAPAKQGGVGNIPSPFDLSRADAHPIAGKPTVDTLLGQIGTMQSKISSLHSQLSTPNLKLNHSQKFLLNNKLADAKAHINSASAKVGVETPTPKEISTDANPLVKFINLLTDGQNQLHSAHQQLEQMKMDGKTLNPGELLLMQVKLGKANNEIEYASILMSKAIDAMKQLFSIQL